MRELFCNTVAIESIDRTLNAPSTIRFKRLDIAFDGDTWAENEPVTLTLAGTLAFKGIARARGYSLDGESVMYDAQDGLAFLAKNACPVVHDYYNRTKADDADAEPINQTIHAIIQTEFATLVTTTAARNYMVVSSLDTSAANSVIPGEVSPKDTTLLAFLDTLCGYQTSLRYYLDISSTTAASPWPCGILKLIDTKNLTTEQLNLVVSGGKPFSQVATPYNVESLSLNYNHDECVDGVKIVGSQYFEYEETLAPAWTPTWMDVLAEFVGWTLDASWAGGQVTTWHPLMWSHIHSVVVTDAAHPDITYEPLTDYQLATQTGYIMRTYSGSITISTTVAVAYQYLNPNAYRRYRTTFGVGQFRLETYAGTVAIHPQPMKAWARWYISTPGCPYTPLEKWQPNYDIPSANEDSPIVYFVEQQVMWEVRATGGYPTALYVPWNRDVKLAYTGRVDYTVAVSTSGGKWDATMELPARSLFIYSDADSVVLWNDTDRMVRLAVAQLDAYRDPKLAGSARVTLATTASTWALTFDLGKRVNIQGTACTTWQTINAVVNQVNYANWDGGACEIGFGREKDLEAIIYPEPSLNDMPEKYLNQWGAGAPRGINTNTPNP